MKGLESDIILSRQFNTGFLIVSKICLKKILLSECTQFIAKQALKSYSSYLYGEVRSFRFGESASNAKSGYTSSLTL
ncbi:MAG: hypothetical protein EWV83_22580 [Microcystis sp. M_OC_Ca_00000000_S217Cul]|uniref:Uncharacterized protein n=1 Tax=Microcystis aeruginosa PCC 9717 TaxID=1160286 RepID=I4FML1_MICAE|nr:MAG: hypothetical protein EWV83_22580 [Microcystis sp. M_OC_Ca_00000000_S217Cul]TRT94798.1 MAG: hypothetical protein EWV66_00060 [Microcystis sp. M_OC_Ca_00000000_C217Col]CCH96886.1 conserved hypothetical protein [Microcystis aeruginosa PCC 9717]